MLPAQPMQDAIEQRNPCHASFRKLRKQDPDQRDAAVSRRSFRAAFLSKRCIPPTTPTLAMPHTFFCTICPTSHASTRPHARAICIAALLNPKHGGSLQLSSNASFLAMSPYPLPSPLSQLHIAASSLASTSTPLLDRFSYIRASP